MKPVLPMDDGPRITAAGNERRNRHQWREEQRDMVGSDRRWTATGERRVAVEM